jgi:acetyl-CoA C-acetyltransferase
LEIFMDAFIVGAVRTAIGKFNGTLSETSATNLGAFAVSEAIKRAGVDKKDIEEVIMGNVISAGLGQNPARQASLWAGVPEGVPCLTINKVCGSGMKSVMLAAQAIKAQDSSLIVAGGMENMTLAPYLLKRARNGYRLGNGEIIDAMVHDGLWDIYNNFHMGMTGEIIAEKFKVTRKDADELSFLSHKKSIKAQENGLFKDEIVPIDIKGKIFDRDEGPRPDTTIEKLGTLKPVFKKDGVVTAGNASQISDGASAVVVASKDKVSELGLKPLARIVDYTTSGLAPELVMEAPIPAVRKLLAKTGLSINDMDLFEHNEAFATASCAVKKELMVPDDRFNVHGGAVALGHPIGCSGARVLVTLMYALKAYGKKRGLATLCLGGGNAVAMVIER